MARSLTYDDIEYISSQIKDDNRWRTIFRIIFHIIRQHFVFH